MCQIGSCTIFSRKGTQFVRCARQMVACIETHITTCLPETVEERKIPNISRAPPVPPQAEPQTWSPSMSFSTTASVVQGGPAKVATAPSMKMYSGRGALLGEQRPCSWSLEVLISVCLSATRREYPSAPKANLEYESTVDLGAYASSFR